MRPILWRGQSPGGDGQGEGGEDVGGDGHQAAQPPAQGGAAEVGQRDAETREHRHAVQEAAAHPRLRHLVTTALSALVQLYS